MVSHPGTTGCFFYYSSLQTGDQWALETWLRNPFEDVSDKELVILAQTSSSAFKPLVDRYWRRLYTFIKRLYFFQHEDIQDILQDAFIKAYRHLHSYDPSYAFSTWMYQITRNCAIDALRKKRTQPTQVSLEDEDMEHLFLAADEQHAHVLQADTAQLKQLIQDLPLKYREALTLRYLEERTYEEMVDILKKPKGTIASLVNRARALVQTDATKRGIQLYG